MNWERCVSGCVPAFAWESPKKRTVITARLCAKTQIPGLLNMKHGPATQI